MVDHHTSEQLLTFTNFYPHSLSEEIKNQNETNRKVPMKNEPQLNNQAWVKLNGMQEAYAPIYKKRKKML